MTHRHINADTSPLIMNTVMHTGENPYQSRYFDKIFSNDFQNKYYLLKYDTKHTGEEPIQCSNCDKTFTENSSLLKRMTTHTGEKPFQCSFLLPAF